MNDDGDGLEEQGNTSSSDIGSFTLDFFDSDELSKIDLGKYHIESKVRYITYVSVSLPRKWLWTKPCKSLLASFLAAENMVCARLLSDDEWSIKDFDHGNGWTHNVRTFFPSWLIEARKYIGETREVIVPKGMSPRKFRKQFHQVQFNQDLEEEDYIGSITTAKHRWGVWDT